ncbi:MAG: hypothetical protein Q8R28_20525 [Dehalococcoidia bacterium]|nr:hypothetical protein [Dehalococcoidia bacterium]
MMPMVPSTLVRITRYYLLTGLVYLVVTLLLAVASAAGMVGVSTAAPSLFWYAAVLGWVSLPIMGAFYQFFPTLQGQDLHMKGWTLPQYGVTNLGLLGMLGSVLAGNATALGVFTTIYALGAFLLAVILLAGNLTLSKVTLTLRFHITAVIFFLSGVTILALNNLGLASLGRPVVSHLVLIGWGVMAIFGSQYIMVPMLQLKTLVWERAANVQYYLAALGVLVLAWGFVGGGLTVVAAGGIMEFLAIALFVAVILRSVTTGPPRLPKMDLSVMFYLAGDAYLVLVALLGISTAVFHFNLSAEHIHLALIGVLTNTIIGAMYHILPFLVWWETYAGKVGLERVPLLKELFNEHFARRSFYFWNGSLWVMIAGFLLSNYYLVALAGAVDVVLAASLLAQMLRLVSVHGDHAPQGQPKGGGALSPNTTGGV